MIKEAIVIKKLDENGGVVPAGQELRCGQNTAKVAAALRASYPSVPLTDTNMAYKLRAFLYVVLANSFADALDGADYFAARDAIEPLAAANGLRAEGYLLLDEGAGHALYTAQKKSRTADSAFGRMPIIVYLEHTTGTVLCEGALPAIFAEKKGEIV